MSGFWKSLFEKKPNVSCIAKFYDELGGEREMAEDVEAFLDATLNEGLLYNWDWREGPEEAVQGVNDLLKNRGLEPLTEEATQQILSAATDKEQLPKALQIADGFLQAQGHRLLAIDTRSDQYCAGIVTGAFYHRWVNVSVAKQILTQDHYRGGGPAPKATAPRDVE